MTGLWRFLAASLAAAALLTPAGAQTPTPAPAGPPVAPVKPVTNTYFGTALTDPYQWMEDLGDPQVKSWFKEQADYARMALDRIPGREALAAQIKKLDGVGTSVSDVQIAGNRYFSTKVLPGFNNRKLYVREGLKGADRLLFDPEALTKNGVHYSMDYYAPSLDGKYVAYGLSPGGSEESVLHVLDIATGRDFPESIDRTNFGSPSWRTDGRSFFYNRLQRLGANEPLTAKYQKNISYLHVLGTDPAQDKPVFGYALSPRVTVGVNDLSFVTVNPDSPYAVGLLAHGVQNETTAYIAPVASLTKPDVPWRKIVDTPDQITGFASHGDLVYLLSHQGASRYKILRVSYSHPELGRAAIVVPPGQAVLNSLGAAQDALYVKMLDGGIGRLLRVPYPGGPATRIALPYEGAIGSIVTDYTHRGVLFLQGGWTRSALWYAYDPRTQRVSDTGLKPLSPVDMSAYASVEVKATSADGTLVPLSIVYKKGLALDGSHPTLVNGYGAYGITIDPSFAPTRIPWLDRGGVLAYAHIRGGGEYGEDWHLGGKLLTKNHTWEDFIACGQYLVDHKYTSPARLAGEGTSAGGITIGRAVTARPDLWGAALIRVGVSNAVRQELSPNGPPNIPEFGTVTEPDGFKALYAMDAYHHVQDGVKYPAVMVETGINDPRVASWEPAKMAARLQAASSSGKPVILRVDYDAGHGIGSTKSQSDELLADEYAFLLWQLGDPAFQPKSSGTINAVTPITVTGE
jgi:prolyl oligopeptidase